MKKATPVNQRRLSRSQGVPLGHTQGPYFFNVRNQRPYM